MKIYQTASNFITKTKKTRSSINIDFESDGSYDPHVYCVSILHLKLQNKYYTIAVLHVNDTKKSRQQLASGGCVTVITGEALLCD